MVGFWDEEVEGGECESRPNHENPISPAPRNILIQEAAY